MRWFRQDDLVEMRKELESAKSKKLLSKISNERVSPFQARDWDEWLDRWKDSSLSEKSQLLLHIFAIYCECPGSEWWVIWLLLFKEELFGLFGYYQQRIIDPDERWSVVIWSFLETVNKYRNNPSSELTVDCICAKVKKTINQCIRYEGKIRRSEVRLPANDLLPNRYDRTDQKLEEEEYFALLCKNVELYFNNLPPTDKMIVEEICLLGHTGKACALHLGVSRAVVNRRLMNIKVNMSNFLKLPVAKRINKT